MSKEEIKARELVDRFENYSFIDIDQKISAFQTAKQCALICVDEMINTNLKAKPNEALDYVIFWNKVKQIIEQL